MRRKRISEIRNRHRGHSNISETVIRKIAEVIKEAEESEETYILDTISLAVSSEQTVYDVIWNSGKLRNFDDAETLTDESIKDSIGTYVVTHDKKVMVMLRQVLPYITDEDVETCKKIMKRVLKNDRYREKFDRLYKS